MVRASPFRRPHQSPFAATVLGYVGIAIWASGVSCRSYRRLSLRGPIKVRTWAQVCRRDWLPDLRISALYSSSRKPYARLLKAASAGGIYQITRHIYTKKCAWVPSFRHAPASAVVLTRSSSLVVIGGDSGVAASAVAGERWSFANAAEPKR